MKKVLVLDANQRSALSTTRSLGKLGVTVHTADESPDSLAGSSRYSKAYHAYPPPKTHYKEFITYISNIVIEHDFDMVLPMTELTAFLLLEQRERLKTIIPFPELSVVNALSDKCLLMKQAQHLNIPIPNTWFIENPARRDIDLASLPYPLVLKPGKSWLFQNGQWIHTTVQFAEDAASAEAILNSDPAFAQHPYMLQECVTGSGQGVFALYNNGTALAFFSHRRLREKPPRGGVSVLSESVAVNPVLLEPAKRLLDEAHWQGIAMVEFKVAEDGTPYLMEINTRFWGSLQLAIDAGVDFPALLYQSALNEPTQAVTDYNIGTRLRWILGDFDSLYLTLRDRELSVKHKLRAVLNFITPAPFTTRHEVNRWNDLAPFWWELKTYLRDIFS